MRKWIYPVIMVLLPLVITGGSQGQARAQTYAATYIGVDAEVTPTWTQANTSGSGYDIALPQKPLTSEKFFYNGPNELPSSPRRAIQTFLDCAKC
jgi:hypothetical protein